MEVAEEGANREAARRAGRIGQPADQHRAHEAGHGDRHERDPPAVDPLEVPAEQEAEDAAEGDAGGEDAQRHGTPGAGEVVGDE